MRIVIGITGASGAALGYRFIERLNRMGQETHVVVSRWGAETLAHETGRSLAELQRLATAFYDEKNMSAAISSGSFQVDAMVVIPCSMKTLAAINSGVCANLVARAADVTLKEGRKLVLVVRETPLSCIHLRNLLELSRLGVTIMPPVMAYYSLSEKPEELMDAFLGRVMDQLGLENSLVRRWQG